MGLPGRFLRLLHFGREAPGKTSMRNMLRWDFRCSRMKKLTDPRQGEEVVRTIVKTEVKFVEPRILFGEGDSTSADDVGDEVAFFSRFDLSDLRVSRLTLEPGK